MNMNEECTIIIKNLELELFKLNLLEAIEGSKDNMEIFLDDNKLNNKKINTLVNCYMMHRTTMKQLAQQYVLDAMDKFIEIYILKTVHKNELIEQMNMWINDELDSRDHDSVLMNVFKLMNEMDRVAIIEGLKIDSKVFTEKNLKFWLLKQLLMSHYI
jgi:hypothetical protein